MPPERKRDRPGDKPRISPIGAKGLDLWSEPGMVNRGSTIAASGVRTDKRDIRRRGGLQVVQRLDNPHDTAGAVVIANGGDYAHAPWHAAQEFPAGPWSIFFHFKAVRPAGNPADHDGVAIFMREVADGTHRSSYGLELKADGTFLAHFSRDSDAQKFTCEAATVANSTIRGFLFFNPYSDDGGSLYLYVNDDLEDTVDGIGDDAVVLRSEDARLTFGQTSDGAIPADLEADTAFAGGVIDAITAVPWPGVDPAELRDNGRSLIDTCRRYARQSWPNPLEAAFHYDFNGDGNDDSYSANHATVVGNPAYQVQLTNPCFMGQHVGQYDKTDGSRELLIIVGGRVYVQPLKVKK